MKITSTVSLQHLATRRNALKGLGCCIALGSVVLKALAAEPPTHEDFREVQRSAAFIGLEVRDNQDRKLGKVKELALDLENGRLVEVIVSSARLLGLSQRTAAVPYGALTFDETNALLRLNVDKKKFKTAPAFAMSRWADQSRSLRVAEVYRYYGQEPYFASDGHASKSGNTATEPLGFIQRSSKLIHLPVKDKQNKQLGIVSSFLFDLPHGRIIHVIVMAPGFQTKSVIPARALRYNAKRDALLLDDSAQVFKDEPRFKWTYGENGDFQQETYANVKVAANDGVNTRQNVQEGSAGAYTPLVQGSSFRDVDKTYRIYTALRADLRLSQNAQNVEVGTLNGRTTLRGHVNTDEGKRIIGEIAAKEGLAENVSNLLEVRPLPVTNSR